MAKPEQVGICLYKLAAREDAVIKRVIAFSGSQGRNFSIADRQAAHIIIASDDTPLEDDGLNLVNTTLVRIADSGAGITQPYDVLMPRPLLVTRVMRTLDEAHSLLQSDAAADAVAEEAPANMPFVKEAAAVPEETVVPINKAGEQASMPEPPTVASDMPGLDAASKPEPVSEAPAPTEATAPEAPQATDAVNTGAIDSEIIDPEPAEQTDTSASAQHKALVVDDSAAIRKQLELELREAGIAADFAEDGEQALQKVADHRYDLVFLDIIMPGIDGYETCRQMRLRSELKKTPIIMLSAKTSPLDEVQGVIAGASTYLTKPVKSEQLQKTLQRVSMWIDNFQVEKV